MGDGLLTNRSPALLVSLRVGVDCGVSLRCLYQENHAAGCPFLARGPVMNLILDVLHVHHYIPFTGTVISTINSGAFGNYGKCPQTMAEASNILRDQCLGLDSCTPNFQALGSDPCPYQLKWMDAAWECAAPQAGGRALIAVSHTLLLIMGLLLAALRTASLLI